MSVAVIYLAVATVPLGLWLTTFLENRFPILSELPEAADGIIVLAGSTDLDTTEARGQDSLNGSAERFTAFFSLPRR